MLFASPPARKHTTDSDTLSCCEHLVLMVVNSMSLPSQKWHFCVPELCEHHLIGDVPKMTCSRQFDTTRATTQLRCSHRAKYHIYNSR